MFKAKNYPSYWRQFSEYIRFERADNKCEQCGIENYSRTARGTKVCLTVAHLDNDEDSICQCKQFFGFKCAKPSHVLALCNACHLAMDRANHIAERRESRLYKKDSERKLFAEV